MGMIFNSDDTNTLIGLVNGRFKRKAFTDFVTQDPSGFSLSNLQNLGGPNSIYTRVCAPLQLVNSNVTLRWEFWLGQLDQQQQTDSQGTTKHLSTWIGDTIYNVIHGERTTPGKYSGIEFFAVPTIGTTIKLDLTFPEVDDNEKANHKTKIITVFTNIVDAFPHHPTYGSRALRHPRHPR
jgi:hypothetical protein